jgi:hypothetical protein
MVHPGVLDAGSPCLVPSHDVKVKGVGGIGFGDVDAIDGDDPFQRETRCG